VLYRLSYVGRTVPSTPDRQHAFSCFSLRPWRYCSDSIDMERVVGIEPTSSAWKAEVLPLNYTR
jgi:hypothetical protein